MNDEDEIAEEVEDETVEYNQDVDKYIAIQAVKHYTYY